jgi:prophage antirepressor-like protein
MTPSSSVPLNTLSGASRVHILRYQGYPIRAMRCPQGHAWFVLADVIRPLQLRNTSTIRKRLKDPGTVALMNVWVPNRVNPQDSGYRDVQAVNSAGLDALLGPSKFAETRALHAWLIANADSLPTATEGALHV